VTDHELVDWLSTGQIVVVEDVPWLEGPEVGNLRHLTFDQAQTIDDWRALKARIDPCRAARGTICLACPLERCIHP